MHEVQGRLDQIIIFLFVFDPDLMILSHLILSKNISHLDRALLGSSFNNQAKVVELITRNNS